MTENWSIWEKVVCDGCKVFMFEEWNTSSSKEQSHWVPLSYGLVPHLSKKLSKFPSSKEHFGSGTWPRIQTLFTMNKFVISVVYQKPDFQVISDLMSANNGRLILHWSIRSNQRVIRVNSVMKCVSLLADLRSQTRLLKTVLMLACLSLIRWRMNLAREIECVSIGFLARLRRSQNYIYIYIAGVLKSVYVVSYV